MRSSVHFILAAAALLLLEPGFAASWTTDDLMGGDRIEEFELSPGDPAAVVWVKSMPNEEKDRMVSHLFRSTPDGKTVQLTRGNESCTHPRFSPDGHRIAFLSERSLPSEEENTVPGDDAKIQVWLMEGGEPYPVTKWKRSIEAFAWRDTNRIVFTAQEPPSDYERAFEQRKDKSRVVEDETNAPPVRLFEADVHSGRVVRLSSNNDRIKALFVSPDGRRAVTIHERSLRFQYDNAVRPECHLWDLESGTSQRILEDRRFYVGHVAWMPDSRGFYVAGRFCLPTKLSRKQWIRLGFQRFAHRRLALLRSARGGHRAGCRFAD